MICELLVTADDQVGLFSLDYWLLSSFEDGI